MPSRIDYFDDPQAPSANSMVPSVNVIVSDDQGRILLGDPASEHVARRGADEGVGGAMAAKIENALVMYASLRGTEAIQFRLHDTILYNSIYRADNELLVNTHLYGFAAAQAPVLHLRATADGSMVSNYLDSFERVWADAVPLE